MADPLARRPITARPASGRPSWAEYAFRAVLGGMGCNANSGDLRPNVDIKARNAYIARP